MRERTIFDWVLTILGLALIALAILALGFDAQLSAKESEPLFKALGQWWYELDRGSYNGIQVLFERHIWAPLWDPVLLTIVQMPVWVVAAPMGIILFVFGRR
ncbi:hypothetical protein JYU02_00665 [bacterium AH-315-P15]|nr:hypothetical protein [bacterium AH-315-P15]